MASSPPPWLGSQGEEGLGTIGAGRALVPAPALCCTSSARVPHAHRLAGLSVSSLDLATRLAEREPSAPWVRPVAGRPGYRGRQVAGARMDTAGRGAWPTPSGVLSHVGPGAGRLSKILQQGL